MTDENKKEKRVLNQFVRGLIGQYKYSQILTFFLISLQAAGNIVLPLLFQQIVDKSLPSGDMSSLMHYIMILVVVMVVALSTGYLGEILFEFTGLKVKKELNRRVIKKFLDVPYSFFIRNSSGELATHLISDIDNVTMMVSQILPITLLSLMQIAGILFIIFFMNWKLALIPVILFFVFYMLVAVINKQAQKKSLTERTLFGKMGAVIINILENIKFIKVGKPYGWLNSYFESHQENYIKSKKKLVLVLKLVGTLGNGMFGIIAFVVFSIGSYMVIKDMLTVGQLLAFWAYIQAIAGPLQLMIQVNMFKMSSYGSVKRVMGILDEKEEKRSDMVVPSVVSKLEAEDISFSFDQKSIIKNCSFSTRSGEITAIVGESGSGKSTIMNMLLGLYKAQEGNIFIYDGIKSYNITEYGISGAGYLEQESMFFKEGTIKDNILLGREVKADKFNEITLKTGVDDFVKKFEKGYDTLISEVSLSGGQKQLLAFARIMVDDPQVLLLDEITSNIDSHTEEKIQELLKQEKGKNKLIIIIAHRLSTIKSADRILMLSEGKICCEGKHEELLSTNEHYRNLVSIQTDKH
ncbi:MAG TPA: ABC transporter ATP-binding protein [Petrotogaceae bacterium]|nr:ABC transporter ATP-binding protein [Petrotogaceae bacterium]HQF32374.1 ABC transporter ATP-binding protein [Petrotogaceae bacterium]HQH31994.1 ABC transporter ATP-binding protein [Petrotogaceae bacterium]HQP57758.1 ABC transporter ATP-binding protein [Petrotogaceae bacterium]